MARVVTPDEAEIKSSVSTSEDPHEPLAQNSTDYNSIKPATQPKTKTEEKVCYRQKGSVCEHAVFFMCLATASYVGVLVRVYSSQLANWDGVALFPSLYPQMVGTIIMGFVGSHKLLLASKHVFLYQAIATGLCGSITTFSSWNSEAVSSLLQTGEANPDNVVRVLGWSTTLLLGLGMSSAALTLGRHVAMLSPWSDSKLGGRQLSTQVSPSCCQPHIVEGIVFLLAWLVSTLVVIVVPYVLGRRDLIFTCVLASFGTYIRWHLAPLNSALLNFKLGTFLVNVGGSWLVGGVVCARAVYAERALVYDVLTGVEMGFCGCLTTVSTFAVELSSLPLKSSYMYALSSIILAQIGLVLIRGTVQWTTQYY